MNKLKVLNVGQGDSFILSIDQKCKFKNYDIYIDLGNGVYDITRMSNENHKKILLLSHAHQDHIGGLSFFLSSNQDLDEIWMPLFYNEISIITDKILHLKGIQNVSLMSGELLSAKNTVSAFYLLQKLAKTTSIKMEGIYKDKKIKCKHLDFFHPVLDLELILGLNKQEIKRYIERLEETKYEEFYNWFNEPYATEIVNYLRGNNNLNYDNSENKFSTFEDINIEDLTSQFSYGLFLKLRDSIIQFVNKPNNKSFSKLYNSLKKSSNDCSIVFKYINEGLDVLFTGDISKEILDYLTTNNNLKSKILKIPHHGSKYNLNKRTLKRINPEYAIISHGNGKFGRQRDPHPNKEIIQMLDDLNVNTLYTNDVEKNNKIILHKPNKIKVWPQTEYYDKF